MQKLQQRFLGTSTCTTNVEYNDTNQVNLSSVVGLWVVLAAFLACACGASAAWYTRERWRRARQRDSYQEGEAMERAHEVAERVSGAVATLGDAVAGSFRRTGSIRGELHKLPSQQRRATTGAHIFGVCDTYTWAGVVDRLQNSSHCDHSTRVHVNAVAFMPCVLRRQLEAPCTIYMVDPQHNMQDRTKCCQGHPTSAMWSTSLRKR